MKCFALGQDQSRRVIVILFRLAISMEVVTLIVLFMSVYPELATVTIIQ